MMLLHFDCTCMGTTFMYGVSIFYCTCDWSWSWRGFWGELLHYITFTFHRFKVCPKTVEYETGHKCT